MYDYAKKMLNVMSEPGTEAKAHLQNLADKAQLESFVHSIINRLAMPSRKDMENLQVTIARLEKSVQTLEQKLQSKDAQAKNRAQDKTEDHKN